MYEYVFLCDLEQKFKWTSGASEAVALPFGKCFEVKGNKQ